MKSPLEGERPPHVPAGSPIINARRRWGRPRPHRTLAAGNNMKELKVQAEFEIYKNPENGRFYFILRRLADGAGLVKSNEYPQKISAFKGIAAIKKNCGLSNRYEMYYGGNKYMFKMKSGNGQVVATSMYFSSKADRDEVIRFIAANAVDAPETIKF